ncbi:MULTISPECIES: sugar transferase [Methylosinus]|nr:sugar transferase [Methylosinus sporium]MBU3890938.1 sugar transferase [Methylosinus sp. KRF6]
MTGWAQVIGARAISTAGKAALDVWYVRNASFVLDLEIVLRTISLVIFGE